MRKIVATALLCSAFAGASAANAEPPALADPGAASAPRRAPVEVTAKDEAISRFKRGIQLYQEGDHQASLSELRRAHALAPSYRVLFNIGQICYELKDYACALTSFQTYLKEGGDAVPAERKATIASDVERLESHVASLEITVNTSGVEISVDDVDVGKAPFAAPVLVNAGRRKIIAGKDGMPDVTRIVDVAGAEHLKIDFTLTPAAAPSPLPVPAAPLAPPSRWTTRSFLGLGVTGALSVGAVVTGVLARGGAASVNETRFVGDEPPPDLIARRDRAAALALTSDVLTGSAIAALATTLILTYTGKPWRARSTKASGLSLEPSPLGASLRGSF